MPVVLVPAGSCGRPFSPEKKTKVRGIPPNWQGVLLGHFFEVKILKATYWVPFIPGEHTLQAKIILWDQTLTTGDVAFLKTWLQKALLPFLFFSFRA